MYRNKIIAGVLCLFLLMPLGGCVTTTTNPDGTTQVSEPDYMTVQLLATASVAAWAATQKDGIRTQDAEAILSVMDAIVVYHNDGTPIDPSAWSVEIAKQVPKRWQGVASLLVQLTAHELEKYGVATALPAPGSVGGKIMEALVTGVKLGVSPYLAHV